MKACMRVGVIVLVAVVCAGSGACSGADEGATAATSGGGGSGAHEHEGVLLEGDVTDAALDALLASTPETVPARFAEIVTPKEATTLDARPTFTWQVVPQKATLRAPLVPSRGAPELVPVPRPRERSVLAELFALVGPERSAFAAPAPFTGTAYLLQVSDAVGSPLFRVFTSNASYTPDDAAWAAIRAQAGKAISAWVMTADFDSDQIAAGGGPFPGPWISFAVSADAK